MVEVVYTPESTQRHGWRLWSVMIKELINSGELIWRLILRDISVRYRQSVLGYAWAIIPAVVTVGISAFLTGSRVVSIGATAIPYVAYALWGISLWQLFSGCLTACTNSLAHSGSLVTKIHFAKEALVIAALGQPLFDFLIRLVPQSCQLQRQLAEPLEAIVNEILTHVLAFGKNENSHAKRFTILPCRCSL